MSAWRYKDIELWIKQHEKALQIKQRALEQQLLYAEQCIENTNNYVFKVLSYWSWSVSDVNQSSAWRFEDVELWIKQYEISLQIEQRVLEQQLLYKQKCIKMWNNHFFRVWSAWGCPVSWVNEVCNTWLKEERKEEKLVHEETMSFVFVSRSSLDRSSLDQQMHVLKQPNGNAVIGYNTNNMCDCVGESIFTFYCMNLHKSSLHISAASDS